VDNVPLMRNSDQVDPELTDSAQKRSN